MDASCIAFLCPLDIASTQKEYSTTFLFRDATTPCQWHLSVITRNFQGNRSLILPAPSRKVMRQFLRYPPIGGAAINGINSVFMLSSVRGGIGKERGANKERRVVIPSCWSRLAPHNHKSPCPMSAHGPHPQSPNGNSTA
jgi:hypothetical protein